MSRVYNIYTIYTVRVYCLHETYTYLGHKINIAGEWNEQVNIIVSDFSSKKLEAIRQLALSEVQHLFSIVHIQQKSLSEMNKKIEGLVRKWFGLNTHSTRDIIFHPQWEGGLGVPNVMWIYTGMRISHLMNMLNSDDKDVSEFARSSLFLDLSKHKVLLAKESEPHFLGFKRKSSGETRLTFSWFWRLVRLAGFE